MYKFTFKINEKDIFDSSMNFNRKWINMIFDCFITFGSLIVLIYCIVTKAIYNFNIFQIIMLVVCVLLFPVIQPALIYLKAKSHAKQIRDREITLEFNDDKIYVSNNNERVEVLYENIYNFIKYKNMIVILYDAIHGQIIPNRVFDNNRDEFYDYVATKIKDARERQKQKSE